MMKSGGFGSGAERWRTGPRNETNWVLQTETPRKVSGGFMSSFLVSAGKNEFLSV